MPENKLKPCPFCGGEAKIRVCDDEGNYHPDEYEFNAWSGLSFAIEHTIDNNVDCPIAQYEDMQIGVYLYDKREDAIESWNRRADNEM